MLNEEQGDRAEPRIPDMGNETSFIQIHLNYFLSTDLSDLKDFYAG